MNIEYIDLKANGFCRKLLLRFEKYSLTMEDKQYLIDEIFIQFRDINNLEECGCGQPSCSFCG